MKKIELKNPIRCTIQVYLSILLLLPFTYSAAQEGSKSEPPQMNPNEPAEVWEVAQRAIFVYGDSSFGKYITNNIRYPETAMDSAIEGRVMIEFIIEKDGSIRKDLIVVRTKRIGYGLEEEAIRVILSSSGKWQPATQKGKPVRMKFRQPLLFKLY